LEGVLIWEGLTLLSEGVSAHDCTTEDRTNLNNQPIGSQLAHFRP
jgi:hypothetical protein